MALPTHLSHIFSSRRPFSMYSLILYIICIPSSTRPRFCNAAHNLQKFMVRLGQFIMHVWLSAPSRRLKMMLNWGSTRQYNGQISMWIPRKEARGCRRLLTVALGDYFSVTTLETVQALFLLV